MIIEISNHGLNFGEEIEYVATYIKGKGKSKLPMVERYRILTKGLKTGNEYILFFEVRENFFGRKKSYGMTCLDKNFGGFRYITPDHIKNNNYNYYKVGYDLSTVDEFFTAYINADPMISAGGFSHQFISGMNNYTWTYKFNNKTY